MHLTGGEFPEISGIHSPFFACEIYVSRKIFLYWSKFFSALPLTPNTYKEKTAAQMPP
jgi:hypothetical protein